MEQETLHLTHDNLIRKREKLMLDINFLLKQKNCNGKVISKITKKTLKLSTIEIALEQVKSFMQQAAIKENKRNNLVSGDENDN